MSKSFLRNAVGEYMTALGKKDNRVVIVNADLSGTCRNKGFVETFPERSFNVGIAEQNMVSFSAGLAYEGFKPYIFSMAPFLTMRACEQVRTDIAYGNKDVCMIGVYAGVSGGISGATHWAIEDCGIMTSVPNVVTIELSDANMAKKVLDLSLNQKGPMYLRVSVEPTEDIYSECEFFEIGGSKKIVHGDDGAILCSGVTVQYALEASRRIKSESGLNIRVVDMYSIKPIDVDAVVNAAKTGRVIVAQDHNVIGGLGSMVANVIASTDLNTKFRILGINDEFAAMAHANYLYKRYEIDSEGIFNNMIKLINEDYE